MVVNTVEKERKEMGEALLRVTQEVALLCEGKCSADRRNVTWHHLVTMESQPEITKVIYACTKCQKRRIYGSVH